MNTDNLQAVGVKGDDIVILAPKNKMTKEEAIAHAAWLVALADPGAEVFQKVLLEVWSK